MTGSRRAAITRRILIAVLLIVLLWPAYLLAIAVLSPFSWRERDWNDDGRTSWGEFMYASELGRMPVDCPGAVAGTEYFLLKDVSTYKVDCGRPWVGDPRPEW